jgi:LSD1 subclass zinc finger protein
MIVTCPKCSRQLNVPENAGGKHVRCPLCQEVFAVPAAAVPAAQPSPRQPPPQQVQAKPSAPPPLPETREEFEEEKPRQPRERESDFGFEDQEADYQRDRLRSRPVPTVGTMAWLYVAFGVDVFLAVLLLVGNLVSASALNGRGGMDRGANVAGGLLCFLVFMALSPFVLLAGIFLGKLTNRALVITGGVMAIIIGSLATIGAVITLVAVGSLAGIAPGRLPAIFYIILYGIVLLYILVACVNFMAGIKALITVSKPEVKERFR